MEGTAFWSSPQNPGRTTRVWGRRVLTVVGDRGPGMRPGSVRPPLGPDTDGPVGAATGGPGRRNHGRAPGDGGSPARRPSSRSARQLAPIPGRRRGGLQRQGAARSAPRGGDRLAPSAWPVYFWSRRRQPLPDLTPAPSRRIVHGRERAWPSLNLPVIGQHHRTAVWSYRLGAGGWQPTWRRRRWQGAASPPSSRSDLVALARTWPPGGGALYTR